VFPNKLNAITGLERGAEATALRGQSSAS